MGSDQTAKTSAGPIPFDFSQPPIIEGFTPPPRLKEETFQEKFIRKTKENPFVPIGCLGTTGALLYGLRAFSLGKTKQSQLLMRGRIFAQGFSESLGSHFCPGIHCSCNYCGCICNVEAQTVTFTR